MKNSHNVLFNYQVNSLYMTLLGPVVMHSDLSRSKSNPVNIISGSSYNSAYLGWGELKRIIPSLVQQPLYLFMRYIMRHWPLDASFRLVSSDLILLIIEDNVRYGTVTLHLPIHQPFMLQ